MTDASTIAACGSPRRVSLPSTRHSRNAVDDRHGGARRAESTGVSAGGCLVVWSCRPELARARVAKQPLIPWSSYQHECSERRQDARPAVACATSGFPRSTCTALRRGERQELADEARAGDAVHDRHPGCSSPVKRHVEGAGEMARLCSFNARRPVEEEAASGLRRGFTRFGKSYEQPLDRHRPTRQCVAARNYGVVLGPPAYGRRDAYEYQHCSATVPPIFSTTRPYRDHLLRSTADRRTIRCVWRGFREGVTTVRIHPDLATQVGRRVRDGRSSATVGRARGQDTWGAQGRRSNALTE